MDSKENNNPKFVKFRKNIIALVMTIIISLIILAVNIYAANVGINTELNEGSIVRLAGAIAMGSNTDRIVTRDTVATVLSGYNLDSSVVTVTDDTTNDYIVVKYTATSRQYKIDKNTIYKITYNANGGSGAPASQEHKHNETTILSTTSPTRSNYKFKGWSTSSTATTATYQPGGTYTTNGDITLYAVWQAMYTVTYNANGGSGAPASQIKYHGETLTLQTGTPTRNNYRFKGWSTSSSATTATYQPGASFTTNANTTLYAVWQAMYTISYNANGGSGAPLAQTKYHGESITLSTTVPTRSGYRFKGWSTSSSATSASYAAGATFTSNADTTLYAVWQKMYTITYNANGGSGAPASQTKYHGESLTLRTGKPTRSNYTFLGWGETSSSTSAKYQPGASFTKDADITLYAVWQANTVTITFNANGGTGGPGTQKVNYGESTALSKTEPSRTGYTFQGWGTSSSTETVSYKGGTSYTWYSNTTIYAIWKINTYTVSYNANGGSGAPSSQTKKYGVALTLSSTKPTRSGYTFQGWGTSSSATSVSYAAGASYTANANITLYAIWKRNTYNIVASSTVQSGYSFGKVSEIVNWSCVDTVYSSFTISGTKIGVSTRTCSDNEHEITTCGYIYTNQSFVSLGHTLTVSNTFTEETNRYTNESLVIRLRNTSTNAIKNLGTINKNSTQTFTMPSDGASYRIEFYITATSTSEWNGSYAYNINTLKIE